MTLQTVQKEFKVYVNGQESSPFAGELVYSDSLTSAEGVISVTASASDETLPIADLGTVKILELRVAPDDIDKITVKYNGSSKAYSVSPIEITSETITGVTASNSSTSAVELKWRVLYS